MSQQNDPHHDNKKDQQDDFHQAYSEQSYWQTVKQYASRAGREVIGKSLTLYYTARDEHTPAWAKTTIYGALGYFISLIDAIPDLTPVVGYSDDLGVLVAALAAVAKSIRPEHRQRAEQQVEQWFGRDQADGNSPTTDDEKN